MRTDLLTIYLNDHLAGATLAIELVKRSRRSNRDEPLGDFLGEMLERVEEERALLESLIRRLGERPDRLKVAGGWLAEKVGRFKLNGALVTYSDLSRVEEVEGLLLGVRGKQALWETLRTVAVPGGPFDGVDFDPLARSAREQIEALERHRREALHRAFAG